MAFNSKTAERGKLKFGHSMEQTEILYFGQIKASWGKNCQKVVKFEPAYLGKYQYR